MEATLLCSVSAPGMLSMDIFIPTPRTTVLPCPYSLASSSLWAPGLYRSSPFHSRERSVFWVSLRTGSPDRLQLDQNAPSSQFTPLSPVLYRGNSVVPTLPPELHLFSNQPMPEEDLELGSWMWPLFFGVLCIHPLHFRSQHDTSCQQGTMKRFPLKTKK